MIKKVYILYKDKHINNENQSNYLQTEAQKWGLIPVEPFSVCSLETADDLWDFLCLAGAADDKTSSLSFWVKTSFEMALVTTASQN